MNQPNVELMKRHFLYEERGDSDAVLAEMCDPPVYYTPARVDLPTRNPDDVRAIHAALFNSLADLHFSYRSLFATDTLGCAELIATGRQTGPRHGVAPTGKPLTVVGASLFTFRDGKIASENVCSDTGSVLRQLGLKASYTASGEPKSAPAFVIDEAAACSGDAHNLGLMRRHFLYEEKGDTDAVLAEMCDPPAYYTPARGDQLTTTRDGVRAIHQSLFDSRSNLKFRFRSLFATTTHGCAELIGTGDHTGPWRGVAPTGRNFTVVGCSIFTFRDGKIASESVCADTASVLRQLGLQAVYEKTAAAAE